MACAVWVVAAAGGGGGGGAAPDVGAVVVVLLLSKRISGAPAAQKQNIVQMREIQDLKYPLQMKHV